MFVRVANYVIIVYHMKPWLYVWSKIPGLKWNSLSLESILF